MRPASQADGLACEEIAELTGKPPATVRSHLRHARNGAEASIMTIEHALLPPALIQQHAHG